MALGNGPKQDWACRMRSKPRLEGFVQFYLGTWLHRRGDSLSLKGGQRSHAAALGGYILVNAGQAK